MYSIFYTKKVKQDFINIENYISKDNPVYAIKTINSIVKTISLLSSFPFVWKEIDKELREIVEINYKYKIVYKFCNEVITVLSVYKYKNSWK